MTPVRVLTVVGARPQFVKAAAVSRAISACDGALTEVLLHTGQHYDEAMSKVFFEELGIPEPAWNLGLGGGRHGEMTGRMLAAIEEILLDHRPDAVLVYGDTNSTLAGALAAVKLHVPVAHVEAGLRSFNLDMPEEVNRVLVDRVSRLLFCPTDASVRNLEREGVGEGIHQVGDVMYDASLHYRDLARRRSTVLGDLGLQEGGYVLATCHRAENTDQPARLCGILEALEAIGHEFPVVWPVHPRTRARMEALGLGRRTDGLRLVEPVSYLDMVRLEQSARAIFTDSGGVQKEAFFYAVPCLTLREETEWVETVESGWNVLCGADREHILAAWRAVDARQPRQDFRPYGQGDAALRIVEALREAFGAGAARTLAS